MLPFWAILVLILCGALAIAAVIGWVFYRGVSKGIGGGGGGFVGGSASRDMTLGWVVVILLFPFWLTAFGVARLRGYLVQRAIGKKHLPKYIKIWEHIQNNGGESITLTFAEIKQIADVEITKPFVIYKNTSKKYGYRVDKISMKNKTVDFSKLAK